MPVFEYQGYTNVGKKAGGVIDADSPTAARSRLRQEGILATTIVAGSSSREFLRAPLSAITERITPKDIALFTRQLATLQAGGLPLVESLDALIEQARTIRLKKIVTDIREKIVQGHSLAEALSQHPNQFDPLYIGLVTTGEAAGALDDTLARLAHLYESRLRQRSKVSAAMIYPAFMTMVGGGVLMYLLSSVVPQVAVMFEDMKQALPLPTVILLGTSSFFQNWWGAILLLGGASAVSIIRYRDTPKGRAWFDKTLLTIPLFGHLVATAAISRFARCLASLLAGGVTLLEALNVTATVVDQTQISEAIKKSITEISEGRALAPPLKDSGLFPPLVTQMIAAGEKTGALPEMLDKIADAYEFEVETALFALTALVEPLLILVMGGAVGFVVMAILLPIFELSQMTG